MTRDVRKINKSDLGDTFVFVFAIIGILFVIFLPFLIILWGMR